MDKFNIEGKSDVEHYPSIEDDILKKMDVSEQISTATPCVLLNKDICLYLEC